MDRLRELFCLIDDFCMKFEPAWHKRLLADGQQHRRRQTRLQLSELVTLAVLFHQLRFRQFKTFYLAYACRFLRIEFPDLPSYHRCVELMPRCVILLAALFDTLKGPCSGISIMDSTPIAVCDNLRIARHKVFAGLAARGKSSTGWFYGLVRRAKSHLLLSRPKGE
jgi:hypothetical protein